MLWNDELNAAHYITGDVPGENYFENGSYEKWSLKISIADIFFW